MLLTDVDAERIVRSRVRAFWDRRPCGVKNSVAQPGTRAFYAQIEAHRYQEESHIPHVVEFERHAGERILEIGGGVGTDGRRLAARARVYVDADLSFNS